MRNLNILQSGGGVYYSSVANPYSAAALSDLSAAASSSSKSSSKDDGLIPKALLEKLSEKGIPTDVNKFMDMLADFEHLSSFGLGVNKRQLYRLLAYANQIIKQSEYLDAAEKQAELNGALDEFAVDARGNLFVPDENGNINKVHASLFDASKHMALTVGELLQQRKFNPTEVDDSSIATTVGSNIGIEKINDYIQGIIEAVGNTEDSSEAYVNLGSIVGKAAARRPTESLMEALKDLYLLTQLLGPDAIFKVKDQYKLKNMEAAMSYIMSMLPNNIKTQLVARNVAAGGKYENSTKYAADIIGMAAMAGDDVKMSLGIDYGASINKAISSGELKSSKTFYQTTNEALFDGDLNQLDIKLSDPGSKNKYGVSLKGNVAPALTTDDNNAVSNLPLGIALNGTIGKYLDHNDIYMGSLKIGEGMLNNIAYSNDQVAAVYMPITSTGEIDWAGFYAYSQAEDEIKRNGITDPILKNQIHAAYHSYIQYDNNGQIIPTDHVARYIMTYGYTIDDHIEDGNLMATELTGENEQSIDNLLDAIYNKTSAKKYGFKKIDRKQVWDDIFKVPVFIKINEFAAGDAYRYAGHGSLMTPKTLLEDMILEKVNAKPTKLILGAGELLYQE